MILIDSLYINNSGGKVLLDYLVNEIEKQNLNAFYLLDQRVSDSYPNIPVERKLFLKATFINRLRFYLENDSLYDIILCFGNVPPPIKVKSKVLTYFHQQLFLKLPDEVPLFQKTIFYAKSTILGLFKRNTNFWLVQSNQMADSLVKRYNLKPNNAKVIPFYPEIISNVVGNIERIANSFVYVSSGSPHKNHIRLLKAFKNFYDLHKTGVLHLTLSPNSSQELFEELKELFNKNYPIINHGFVKREKLYELYMSCAFTIYPSLSESFGLGIVEAIECGCNVIGADLPYLYAVCEPSLVFDPLSVTSISAAMGAAVSGNIKPTKQLINNEIKQLIELLS